VCSPIAMKAVFFESGHRDILLQVLEYLNHRDIILSLSPLSKQLVLRGDGRANIDYNYTFLQLCRRRYNVENEAKFLRSIGASKGTWLNAFELASRRQRIPYGIYTSSPYGDNIIFARGRKIGIDIWLLVNHTPDALLRTSSAEQQESLSLQQRRRYIDLRLVVQNFGNDSIAVDTAGGARSSYRSSGGDDKHIRSEPLDLIACNGQKCQRGSGNYDSNNNFATIGRYDCHVYSCHLYCALPPSSSSSAGNVDDVVGNELDFLTITSQVSVVVSAWGRNWELAAELVDEAEVAESYLQLPGGVVLLREKGDRRLADY